MKDDVMTEDKWERITEVPSNLAGYRALACEWLIKHADNVYILRMPKGKSRYKAYFDDGAYKGGWNLEFAQATLTPLNVIQRAAHTTNWPGLVSRLQAVETFAENMVAEELGKITTSQAA